MPDVRNCKKCGKIFNYLGGEQLCPVCKQLDEEDFKRVKEYLYNNPGATMSQISMELDISIEKIKRFLREGRLEIIGDEGNLVLECEMCGKAIKFGKYCEMCEKDLSKDLKVVADKLNQNLSQSFSKSSELRYLYRGQSKDQPKK